MPLITDSVSWLYAYVRWTYECSYPFLHCCRPSYHNQLLNFNSWCQERKQGPCSATRSKSSFCLACRLIPEAKNWSTVFTTLWLCKDWPQLSYIVYYDCISFLVVVCFLEFLIVSSSPFHFLHWWAFFLFYNFMFNFLKIVSNLWIHSAYIHSLPRHLSFGGLLPPAPDWTLMP